MALGFVMSRTNASLDRRRWAPRSTERAPLFEKQHDNVVAPVDDTDLSFLRPGASPVIRRLVEEHMRRKGNAN
jgi:hypothetical protein